MDIHVPGKPGELPLVAHAAEMEDALIDGYKHFAFDWNGWGIGVDSEPSRAGGESIAAWQSGVRAILDLSDS